MTTSAFDETELPQYVCKKHPDRLVVEPIAYRRCQQCKVEAQSTYADAMMKRDKERWYTSSQWDTDTSAAPLRGVGSREWQHKQHTIAAKDKDE